jgi:hypothetical protein
MAFEYDWHVLNDLGMALRFQNTHDIDGISKRLRQLPNMFGLSLVNVEFVDDAQRSRLVADLVKRPGLERLLVRNVFWSMDDLYTLTTSQFRQINIHVDDPVRDILGLSLDLVYKLVKMRTLENLSLISGVLIEDALLFSPQAESSTLMSLELGNIVSRYPVNEFMPHLIQLRVFNNIGAHDKTGGWKEEQNITYANKTDNTRPPFRKYELSDKTTPGVYEWRKVTV